MRRVYPKAVSPHCSGCVTIIAVSMSMPVAMAVGIWMRSRIVKSDRSRIACIAMNTKCMIAVSIPIESSCPGMQLITYGGHSCGMMPRFALMHSALPAANTAIEAAKSEYLLIAAVFMCLCKLAGAGAKG